MEPLFKTTRVMTEKYAREIFRNTSFMYHFFYFSVFIVVLWYIIYWAYWYYEINAIMFILFLLEIIAYIARPYTVGKNRIKEYKALHNETETDEYLFFDEYILTRDIYSKSELNVDYKNITSVRSSKNFYYFSIKNSKTKLVVPKNTNDETKTEEFIDFINGKIIYSKNKLK